MINYYDDSSNYILTQQNVKHETMLMDINVYFFASDVSNTFIDDKNETAFLLVKGEVDITYNGITLKATRDSFIDQKPYCLHIPKNIEVTIKTYKESEVLIQKTINDKIFEPVFYTPTEIEDVVLCENLMEQTAKRILRDIFTYKNAPYSNMVMGEVITLAGRWSSYPPHHHRQPEVYYYRFEKEQGFGVSIIGDDAFVTKDKSYSTIKGGLCHPQVAAPGYSMYYCWMIRHLDNDPWTERIDDPNHVWLYENNI